MLSHIIASSLLIIAVLLIRLIFSGRVPNRIIYALWIAVFIRLAVPGFVFEITLPETVARVDVFGNIAQGVFSETDYYRPQYSHGTSDSENPSTDASVPHDITTSKPAQSRSFEINVPQIYLVGVCAAGIWIFASELSVWRHLKKTRRFVEKRNGVNVYISDDAASPCVFGIIPSVYVTSSSMGCCCEYEFILMHEFSHIRQCDHIRTLARAVILALHWYNPLVWMYFRIASRDAELACDEYVIKGLDERQRLKYARTIFNYAPRTKNNAAGFGGKPMKKRIIAITDNKKAKNLSLILAIIMSLSVCVLAFTGCVNSSAKDSDEVPAQNNGETSESNSLPEADDNWPAELLPEDFPKPEYTEIYSAERKGDEVIIVMFAEDKQRPVHYVFEKDLHFKYGYRTVFDVETGDAYWLSRNGYKFTVISSMHPNTHLSDINEKSPTGYTYEIRLSPTDTKIDVLFWQYPDADTDLGLEEKVFEEWDESILPEGFPKPSEELTIVSIEQKSNGVFITLRGTSAERADYLTALLRSGFYHTGVNPLCNNNGDYVFEEFIEFPNGPDADCLFYYQVCKANDKIVK